MRNFLSYAFRPFFLFNGLFAIAVISVWITALHGAGPDVLPINIVYWHGHEMLVGFAMAAIAGFVLTLLGVLVIVSAGDPVAPGRIVVRDVFRNNLVRVVRQVLKIDHALGLRTDNGCGTDDNGQKLRATVSRSQLLSICRGQ